MRGEEGRRGEKRREEKGGEGRRREGRRGVYLAQVHAEGGVGSDACRGIESW